MKRYYVLVKRDLDGRAGDDQIFMCKVMCKAGLILPTFYTYSIYQSRRQHIDDGGSNDYRCQLVAVVVYKHY